MLEKKGLTAAASQLRQTVSMLTRYRGSAPPHPSLLGLFNAYSITGSRIVIPSVLTASPIWSDLTGRVAHQEHTIWRSRFVERSPVPSLLEEMLENGTLPGVPVFEFVLQRNQQAPVDHGLLSKLWRRCVKGPIPYEPSARYPLIRTAMEIQTKFKRFDSDAVQ